MASVKLVTLARVALFLGAATVGVLLLGPFQGAERLVYLSDKQAHALAFFGLTMISFVAGARVRRGDLALALIALAAASEVAQFCVGRDGSLADVLADAAGVLLAWAPTQAMAVRARARAAVPPVERRRRQVRCHDISGTTPRRR
jgi:VanZ family protein